LNNDGYMDVLIGNEHLRKSRVWEQKSHKWIESDFPVSLVELNNAGNRKIPA